MLIIYLYVIILQIYLRFIRFHALVHFPPFDALLRRSKISGLAISSVALLGIGWLGGFYSHRVYTLLLEHLESAHKWDVFTRCVVQHLGLLAEYQGLQSVLGGSTSTWCGRLFRRMRQSCRRIRFHFLREMDFILSNILGFLLYCIRVYVFICPLLSGSMVVPCAKGSLEFPGGLILYCEKCSGKTSSCLLV